jgi:uncharacterized membrane protein
VSLDFLLAFLFIAFAAVSFFTMLHLMGTGHTKHGRLLRSVHRISELLAILVFAVVMADNILNLVRSGFSTGGVILLTLGAVLIPLLIVKNLISERYPELRNRLISIGTTVLVIVFVFSAASAMFHFLEGREATAEAERAWPAVDMAFARDLFVTKCSKCHRLDAPLSETHEPEEWRATVEAMRLKDPTWISQDQAEAIAEFLIYVGAKKE